MAPGIHPEAGARLQDIRGRGLKQDVHVVAHAFEPGDKHFGQDVGVACQRDGTTVLPRGWDHLEVLSSMADLVSGVNGDAPALAVGGAFDDEGVRA